MYTVKRFHDICAGHRVVGHEGKCRYLHGHNYRVHFSCVADVSKRSAELGLPKKHIELDDLGRVIDFGVIKEKLCMWLEVNWDHKFIAWNHDEAIQHMARESINDIADSLVFVPFNPTAENMAAYLVEVIGPMQLEGTGVVLEEVKIEETYKCHVSYAKEVKNCD